MQETLGSIPSTGIKKQNNKTKKERKEKEMKEGKSWKSFYKMITMKLSIVAYACNPSIRRQRQKDQEFEVSLATK
jgi:hypothetical protein